MNGAKRDKGTPQGRTIKAKTRSDLKYILASQPSGLFQITRATSEALLINV
jgi:hypothetical protein